MAKLSDEEQATLRKLREKEKAPDTPPPAVNFSLDLSSDKAYERAVRLGLISEPSDDDNNGDGDDGDGDGDDTPRRRGFFGDQ